MLEKFESLHLMGFESIKFLEEQEMAKDRLISSEYLEKIRFMSVEDWEKSLTNKDRRKISKRMQDQKKVLKRILETDLGLITDQEMHDEIKYRKSSKGMPKYNFPNLRFGKSVSAPDMSQVFSSAIGNTNTQFPLQFPFQKDNIPTPPLRRFESSFVPEPNIPSFRQPPSDYDGGDNFLFNREGNYESYKPYGFNRFATQNQYLDECSYSIDRKKMNDIAENVERYISELPPKIQYQEQAIDIETEKLKDSTYYASRDRHSSLPPHYNHGVLNEIQNKIKS